MQPLTDPELIEEFCEAFPTANVKSLTKLFENDNFLCYKDKLTNLQYLYDVKLRLWLKDATEYWRNVPLT